MWLIRIFFEVYTDKFYIYTVTRGGLTSISGNDITTGQLISRFDLEVGCLVVPGQEYRVGMVHDTNLDSLAD